MSSLQTIKHVEEGIPMDGVFCLQAINQVDNMLMGCPVLAQVQRQMMDIPLKRTVNDLSTYAVNN